MVQRWDRPGAADRLQQPPVGIALERLTAALACNSVPLFCDIQAFIEDRVDADMFRFVVPDGARINLSMAEVGSTTFSPYWRILRADGTAYGSWSSSANSDIGPLPVTGNPYHLQVRSLNLAYQGHYEFRISGCTPQTVDVPDPALVFTLHPNVPNPFNPSTTLFFDLSESGDVSLDVLDPRGRLVARLLDDHLDPGRHEAVWRGRDSVGRQLPSGLYFARLSSGGRIQTQRMVLIR